MYLRHTLLLFLLFALLSCAPASAASAPKIERIAASDNTIRIEISNTNADAGSWAIYATSFANQALGDTGNEYIVWQGEDLTKSIDFPRFVDGSDRLYDRFQLKLNGVPIGGPQFPTDIEYLNRDYDPLPVPTSFKGLQCIVDLDDAAYLGVHHSAINVSFAQLYDDSKQSELIHHVDEMAVHLNSRTVQHLDQTVRRMNELGIRVYLILLNYVPPPVEMTTELVDPHTDRTTPQHMGGFHLSTPDSARIYRGIIEFLANRYDGRHDAVGRVAGYIVGNEVQSHFDWYNLGDIQPDDLINNYNRALRIADMAVRKYHPEGRVYVSLDHNWTRQHRKEATRAIPGRVLLDSLQQQISAAGDFPWGVAFHPYPENLGNPRTWDDSSAKLTFSTPRITFKNLEVLTTYLSQPQFLFEGQPRSIILSEQGFHCLTTPDAEPLQAAAYVYAYERVRRLQGIDAFIYHRHVDHANEGGLRLGLRENQAGTVSEPGRPRMIHEIFRKIDTPESQIEFALDIIGISDWDDLTPRTVTP